MAVSTSLFGRDAEIIHERDFQALLLANVMGPLGSGIVSPILDSLIGPFGTSAADIGLVISFFTAPAIVMIPVAGVITDRIGRKPVLMAGLLVFGLAGTAIAFTTDFRTVLALRLLQGVAFGGITPVIITSLGDIYEGPKEATAQGVRFTGSGLSSTVFPLASGGLVVVTWQYPFFLYAVAFPIAAVVYVWFDEPTDAVESTDETTTRGQLRALLALTAQRRVLAMVLARGLPMFVWIGFITYNSIIVVQVLEGTATQAGMLFAVASLGYAAAASQAGRLTDTFRSRLFPLIGANVCLGVGFIAFLFAPSVGFATAGVALVGTGFGICLSLYRSVVTGLAGESLRGGLVSLAEAFGRVVATATPVCMGAVIAAVAPQVGLAAAVRTAGVGVAIVATGGGIGCLVVARAARTGSDL